MSISSPALLPSHWNSVPPSAWQCKGFTQQKEALEVSIEIGGSLLAREFAIRTGRTTSISTLTGSPSHKSTAQWITS